MSVELKCKVEVLVAIISGLTNWIAVKKAERSPNESLEHLVVQFYRGDHANNEEMNSTSNRKQKQATD